MPSNYVLGERVYSNSWLQSFTLMAMPGMFLSVGCSTEHPSSRPDAANQTVSSSVAGDQGVITIREIDPRDFPKHTFKSWDLGTHGLQGAIRAVVIPGSLTEEDAFSVAAALAKQHGCRITKVQFFDDGKVLNGDWPPDGTMDDTAMSHWLFQIEVFIDDDGIPQPTSLIPAPDYATGKPRTDILKVD